MPKLEQTHLSIFYITIYLPKYIFPLNVNIAHIHFLLTINRMVMSAPKYLSAGK